MQYLLNAIGDWVRVGLEIAFDGDYIYTYGNRIQFNDFTPIWELLMHIMESRLYATL